MTQISHSSTYPSANEHNTLVRTAIQVNESLSTSIIFVYLSFYFICFNNSSYIYYYIRVVSLLMPPHEVCTCSIITIIIIIFMTSTIHTQFLPKIKSKHLTPHLTTNTLNTHFNCFISYYGQHNTNKYE